MTQSSSDVIRVIMQNPASSGFDVASTVTLLAAILAAFMAWYNGKQQRETNEKWEQKKIDADLTAKARIDWIQKVRKESSNLISSVYGLLEITLNENLGFQFLFSKDFEYMDKGKVLEELKEKLGFDDKTSKVAYSIFLNLYGNASYDEHGDKGIILEDDNRAQYLLSKEERNKEFYRIIGEIRKSIHLLILYFGPDKAKINNKIVQLLQEIDIDTKDNIYKFDKFSLDKDISLFENVLREYLKVEWKRACSNDDDDKKWSEKMLEEDNIKKLYEDERFQ